MPKVKTKKGIKKFSYTAAGKKAAKTLRKKIKIKRKGKYSN